MSKKIIFYGVFALSILYFSPIIFAEQYYDQYPGNGFLAQNESLSYWRESINDGYIFHNDTSDAYYMCPVNFNVPDGSAVFIKSLGIRYFDGFTLGEINVDLKRENLYTGAVHTVATWSSGIENSSGSVLTASKGTEPGVKLINTKKFVYWLKVQFWVDGSISPSTSLKLYQVRIHYGT